MAVSGRRVKKQFASGSDEDYSLVCLPCHRDKKTVPAFGYCIDCKEHLCHICYTHHKTPTPCRHHQLQDKDSMPSTQQLDASIHAGTIDSLTNPCPHHKKEMIKLYCHGHNVLLCSVCVALKHTKTCHVDYIPDISDQMINSHEYKCVMGQMDKLLTKCSNIKTVTSRHTSKSKDSLNNALMEIQKYRQDVNTRLDKLQSKVENKIQTLQHQNDEREKTTDTVCEDVKKIVKTAYDSIKQLNTSKKADQLFIDVKQVQEQLQEYESTIRSISTEEVTDEYTFIPSQTINDALFKEQMIGDISAKPKHQARGSIASPHKPVPTSVNYNITTTSRFEICVKTPEDRETCCITGVTVLSPDTLVLTDSNNNSVKLVGVNSKSTTSQLSLGTNFKDEPWDITSTTSTQVAVTVPKRRHIQFISVSNKLSKSHTIQTDGYCWGICCYQNKLIVTYRKPAKLEILDMEGRVKKTVTTDSSGVPIFSAPHYVHANSRSIYVSDENIEYIISLNWQGEITGRMTYIPSSRGLAMLSDGSLLVCDHESDKVQQVSADCVKTIMGLQDVRCPYAVCVDDAGHTLYISRWTGRIGDLINNNILVYNINI